MVLDRPTQIEDDNWEIDYSVYSEGTGYYASSAPLLKVVRG